MEIKHFLSVANYAIIKTTFTRRSERKKVMAEHIYWAGDSTVKENTVFSFPQTGIGQVFKLFVKRNIAVLNFAENGRSTKSFIAEGRIDTIQKRIDKGDFLFIQFGHNDEKINDPSRYTAPYGEYQENLLEFINVAREAGAYPVLITSLYRRLFNEDGKTLYEKNHGDYPDAMTELAKRENVPLIDLCSISRKMIEEAGDEETKRWFLHVPAGRYSAFPDGKEDNSHLQYEGAVRFAQIIADELNKMGGVYSDILIKKEDNLEDPRLLIDWN